MLQGRAGYKELFQHWLALRAGTRFQDDALWGRLLDARDCATLYELWSFFRVKALLAQELGLGTSSALEVVVTNEGARLPWRSAVSWNDGRQVLAFNDSCPGRRPHPPGGGRGSYSVALRPDLTLRVKRPGGRTEALVLDAKLKSSGERALAADAEDADGEAAGGAPARRAVQADLHKMHAYRDALGDVVGAFVLFPGNTGCAFPAAQGGRAFEGVGAYPLAPGERPDGLVTLLRDFLA